MGTVKYVRGAATAYLDDALDIGDVHAKAGLAENLDVRAGVGHKEELGALAELVVADHEAEVAIGSLSTHEG